MKWTDSQLRAINERGKNILVSASAGSGKTGVLVERIVSRIVSGDLSADRMLVVTFTNAAASEMREKIIKSLKKAIAQNPSDRRLRKQAVLMQSAGISTVHAFCLELIKRHYYELKLPAQFSLGSQAEMDEIKNSVYEALMTEKYQDVSDDTGFEKLILSLSGPRDDVRFKDVVFKIYNFSRNNANPDLWLCSLADMYRGDTEEFRKWVSDNITGRCFEEICEALILAQRYSDKLSECPLTAKNYALTASEDAKILAGLKKTLLKGEWSEIVKAYNEAVFENLRALRIPKDTSLDGLEREISDSFKDYARKDYRNIVSAHMKNYFFAPFEDMCRDIAGYSDCVNELVSIVSEFSRRFAEEKLKREMLDFSDLEHYALKILIDESGEPTDVAASLAQGFDEVFVDEYQDTNGVQDLIFKILSSGKNNLFMVGDVKQSIYGFRSANPEIFLDRFETYKSGSPFGESIVLSENFRSRREVIDSINFLMGGIFSKKIGQISYAGEHALKPAAYYPQSNWDYKTEFVFIDMKANAPEEGNEDEPAADVRASAERCKAEGRYIAERIKRYVDEGFEVYDPKGGRYRKAEYSDFAVLLRTHKNISAYYREALESEGIPSDLTSRANFFERYEILLLTSVLKAVDNPRQEISLAAAMNSPVFNFTPDDLLKIRAKNPASQFYDAVCDMAQSGDEKCGEFLSKLDKMREDAQALSAYEFIFGVCSSENIFTIAGRLPDGRKRQQNLWTLLETARGFESGRYRGLSEFVSYLDALKNRQEDIRDVFENPASCGVKIMSVHQSKGLEFPVVFLAGVSKRFNDSDERSGVCINEKFGIGFKAKDYDRFLEYPLLTYNAIKAANRDKDMSEEARILYVALTRAREKLFVVSSSENLEKTVAACCLSHLLNPLTPVRMQKAKSYAEWIMPSLLFSGAGKPLLEYAAKDIGVCIKDAPVSIAVTIAEGNSQKPKAMPARGNKPDVCAPDGKTIKTIAERINFKYPYLRAAEIPSKLTPSELKLSANNRIGIAPKTRSRGLYESVFSKSSAALAGTSTHKVMQFMDFTRCSDIKGVKQEISRLVSEGFISQSDASLVNSDKIFKFFESDVAREMLSAHNILREFKFSLLIDSEELFPDVAGEKILLQGVIDCAFEKDGAFTVIDFKTDRVRGDAAEYAFIYRPQIEMYSKAIERLTGKKTAARYIYFFDLDSPVAI